jgi:hypothetical protein
MISIRKSPSADTRTCDYTKVSEKQLLESSIMHIGDVGEAMNLFCTELFRAAVHHDQDKITDIAGFYRDFATGFKQTEWWDRHRMINRHHLTKEYGVPEGVNLIDVLEMIADCVMAGMARSGEVYPLEIPPTCLCAPLIIQWIC